MISQIFPVPTMFASNNNSSRSNINSDGDITVFPDLDHVRCRAEHPQKYMAQSDSFSLTGKQWKMWPSAGAVY